MGSYEKTLGEQIDKTCEAYPENEAIVFNDQRINYREYQTIINKLAKGLMALGVEKEDKVALWISNRPEFVISQLAIAKIGAVMVPLNTRYKSHEVKYILKHSDATTLIMMDNFLGIEFFPILEEVFPTLADNEPGKLKSEELPLMRNVICIGEKNYDGTMKLNDVIENKSKKITDQQLRERQKSVDGDYIAMLPYTAGTTGFPKGVMISHNNILRHMDNNATLLNVNENDRLIVYLPLFHVFGSIVNVGIATIRGACLVLQEYFDPEESLKIIEKEKVTVIMGVPTMYHMQITHKNFEKYDVSSVKVGELGASTIPVELAKAIVEKMCPKLMSGYGMTEASSTISGTRFGDDLELVATTVGKAFPETELKIADPETGETLPAGEQGEFLTRGFHIMKGYYKDPEATAKAIDKDGWLHTGDLGVMLENGYFKFVGRLKEMFISGGFNVYPPEIENFLFSHPKIKQVYVIGVPDKVMGEVGMAFVELNDEVTCTKEELIDYCKGKIANFKVPKYFEFTKEFPMTASGKVQKFKLEDKAKEILS